MSSMGKSSANIVARGSTVLRRLQSSVVSPYGGTATQLMMSSRAGVGSPLGGDAPAFSRSASHASRASMQQAAAAQAAEQETTEVVSDRQDNSRISSVVSKRMFLLSYGCTFY